MPRKLKGVIDLTDDPEPGKIRRRPRITGDRVRRIHDLTRDEDPGFVDLTKDYDDERVDYTQLGEPDATFADSGSSTQQDDGNRSGPYSTPGDVDDFKEMEADVFSNQMILDAFTRDDEAVAEFELFLDADPRNAFLKNSVNPAWLRRQDMIQAYFDIGFTEQQSIEHGYDTRAAFEAVGKFLYTRINPNRPKKIKILAGEAMIALHKIKPGVEAASLRMTEMPLPLKSFVACANIVTVFNLGIRGATDRFHMGEDIGNVELGFGPGNVALDADGNPFPEVESDARSVEHKWDKRNVRTKDDINEWYSSHPYIRYDGEVAEPTNLFDDTPPGALIVDSKGVVMGVSDRRPEHRERGKEVAKENRRRYLEAAIQDSSSLHRESRRLGLIAPDARKNVDHWVSEAIRKRQKWEQELSNLDEEGAQWVNEFKKWEKSMWFHDDILDRGEAYM